jgi:hypothetical protein
MKKAGKSRIAQLTAAYEFRMIPQYARNIRRLQGGIEK